jgi:8-oxo-dGTP pyrophosphatase MutT (NUDIX family)
MKGRKPWEAAAQEALEEAGIVGRPRKKPAGTYTYFKRQEDHFDVCRVDVFFLEFAKQLKNWREKGQREIRWQDLSTAADMVEEPGLIALLRQLAERPPVSAKRKNSKKPGASLGHDIEVTAEAVATDLRHRRDRHAGRG